MSLESSPSPHSPQSGTNPKLSFCVEALRLGEVIAYPTEAVWGLGCDPFNEAAVAQVLRIKRRAPEKGLILAASDISQFDFLLHDLPPEQLAKLRSSWPGHNTWLVPHHGRVLPILSGQHDTIALRVSAHPIVVALCRKFGRPIVSTSANPQGLPPALNATKVRRYFAYERIYLAPGRVGQAQRPSTIRDLRTGEVIR